MDGYIGHFDILGYQSFLHNNPDEAVQESVLKYITSIEKPAPDAYKDMFPGVVGKAGEAKIKEAWAKVRWLVFSDTILFAVDPKDEKPWAPCILSIRIAAHLMFKMFEYGLPMRGALHFGQYKFLDHSIAGKGIVEAYRYGQGLNLSTCVFTPEMEAQLDRVIPPGSHERPYTEKWFHRYNTPMKDGRRESRLNVHALSPHFVDVARLRDHTHRKFWAHGKDLDDSAISKMEETERFLRFCAMKNEKSPDAA